MKLRPVLLSIGWAGLFGLAYTQAPLPYSNQNQYLLHGFGAADDGPLRRDWLANTASPTPVFDALVFLTVKHGHGFAFHGYYALLLGVYWSSLVGVFDFLTEGRAPPRRRLAFAALLMLAHSALLRWASYRLLDADYPCYAQGWLAAQYVLGPVFQPSAFGVFLIAAIHQFLRNRPLIAAACLGLACLGHATYLLPAAILTLTFAAMLAFDGRRGRGAAAGALALLLVLPVLIYGYETFRPTSSSAFMLAESILVDERIPHHCKPRQWFDAIAGLQIALMAASLLLVRRTRLFPVLGVLFVASAALTFIQLATDNRALALLFPWRSSVVLLPLATAIALTRLVMLAGRWIESTPSKGVALAAVGGGLAIMVFRQGYATNDAEEPLMAFVRANRRPDGLYLIPVAVPNLTGNRGSISSDFKPLPAQKADGRVIPVDFQRFRLVAGVPVHVDFKAIPYRDVDVLEWRARVAWNAEVTKNRTAPRSELLERGITHVVAARDRDWSGEGLTLLYEDDNYRLYTIGR